VFEDGTFVPTARITDRGSESIVTDYLGTPNVMFDGNGNKTWEADLDIYGRVRTFAGRSLNECPFRYQGQYEDSETGLYYNRFRYYDPDIGNYLSQDPIRLAGGDKLYAYVHDPNSWIDVLGLSNNYPRQSNGRFGNNPNPKLPKPSTHGNSNLSTATNYLYAKYDKDGNFLKWGKTDNPTGRYSTPELDGGKIEILGEGGSITDIKRLERELAEKMPGVDNYESWAGSKKGQALSSEAEARAKKAPHYH
jgi:RHS repeat-associated protein